MKNKRLKIPHANNPFCHRSFNFMDNIVRQIDAMMDAREIGQKKQIIKMPIESLTHNIVNRIVTTSIGASLNIFFIDNCGNPLIFIK